MGVVNEPYKEAYVYIGDESMVRFSWFNQMTKKYKPEKVRLGIKGLSPAAKAKTLQKLCNKINIEIRRRNKLLIYHDTNDGLLVENYHDNLILNCLNVFRKDKENGDYQKALCRAVITRTTEFFKEHPIFEKLLCSQMVDSFTPCMAKAA